MQDSSNFEISDSPVPQFEYEHRSNQHERHRIRRDDRPGPDKNSIYQPAGDAGKQHEPHGQAHVFRASRAKGFDSLRQKRDRRKNGGEIAEPISHARSGPGGGVRPQRGR